MQLPTWLYNCSFDYFVCFLPEFVEQTPPRIIPPKHRRDTEIVTHDHSHRSAGFSGRSEPQSLIQLKLQTNTRDQLHRQYSSYGGCGISGQHKQRKDTMFHNDLSKLVWVCFSFMGPHLVQRQCCWAGQHGRCKIFL